MKNLQEAEKTNYDRIFDTLNDLCHGTLEYLHDESTGYAFFSLRWGDGRWETVSFDFINGMAGFDPVNHSLL